MEMCNVIKSSELVKHIINCSNNKYPPDVITSHVSSERSLEVEATPTWAAIMDMLSVCSAMSQWEGKMVFLQ